MNSCQWEVKQMRALPWNQRWESFAGNQKNRPSIFFYHVRISDRSEVPEEYYDLRKTLPRFYRFFEHLNKGQRPTTSVLANALEVVEKMSYAPVALPGAEKGSRLAYGPTKPEILERFPTKVGGEELARWFLDMLLPFTEKELRSESVLNIQCQETCLNASRRIEIYDAEIQPTAPPGLLATLGLPHGRCFQGRGIICAWRHAAMSNLGTVPQPLEQLLSGCLSGHEFLWFTFGVLQRQAYEGNWLQRPGRREEEER
eukprot:s1609_g3.t1